MDTSPESHPGHLLLDQKFVVRIKHLNLTGKVTRGKCIGGGADSEVYEGRRENPGQDVAMKVLRFHANHKDFIKVF